MYSSVNEISRTDAPSEYVAHFASFAHFDIIRIARPEKFLPN